MRQARSCLEQEAAWSRSSPWSRAATSTERAARPQRLSRRRVDTAESVAKEEAASLVAVRVEVDVELHVARGAHLLNQSRDCEDRRVGLALRLSVDAVKVEAPRVRAVVPSVDPVGINHWDQLEDELAAEGDLRNGRGE